MILLPTAPRLRAANFVVLLGYFLLQPLSLLSTQHPFSFKGVAKLHDTYLFSVLDTASGKSLWLRPCEDVNGFSIVAFDPSGRVLTFEWKDVSGIMYLGGASAGVDAQNLHQASSKTRIEFNDSMPQIGKSEKTSEQSIIRYVSSGKSFAIKDKGSAELSIKIGAPQDLPPDQVSISTDQAVPNEGGVEELSIVELRNRIGVNRVNSRLHASDHIRDHEKNLDL